MDASERSVDAVVRQRLDSLVEELESKLDADVLSFIGDILPGVEHGVRQAIEALPSRRKKLAVVLDTSGGVVEVVERMVTVMRHHYEDVAFYIPDRAMSAGTVFALSGDSIWMNYFSVLGPIDPQLPKEGRLIPVVGYLTQYEELIQKSSGGRLSTAEALLLQKMDLGELQSFKEARELSISLLKRWLVQYKFKDWTATETQKIPVTSDMKEKRAESIARKLCDQGTWHSHGRGIPMSVLRGEDLKLRIDDFEADPDVGKLFHDYFFVLREFAQKGSFSVFIHNRKMF